MKINYYSIKGALGYYRNLIATDGVVCWYEVRFYQRSGEFYNIGRLYSPIWPLHEDYSCKKIKQSRNIKQFKSIKQFYLYCIEQNFEKFV